MSPRRRIASLLYECRRVQETLDVRQRWNDVSDDRRLTRLDSTRSVVERHLDVDIRSRSDPIDGRRLAGGRLRGAARVVFDRCSADQPGLAVYIGQCSAIQTIKSRRDSGYIELPP